jgi:hypothetical protein
MKLAVNIEAINQLVQIPSLVIGYKIRIYFTQMAQYDLMLRIQQLVTHQTDVTQ